MGSNVRLMAKRESAKARLPTVAAQRPGQFLCEHPFMLRPSTHSGATAQARTSRSEVDSNHLGPRDEKANAARYETQGERLRWDLRRVPIFSAGDGQRLRQEDSEPARLPIQTKIVIGHADDPLEHEADRVSEQVMRMPDSGFNLGNRPFQISFKSADSGEGRKLREREVPRIVYEALDSPGRPLDSTTRTYFEPRFGHDFSRVRVHANEVAARSARDVSAKAYTVGHNIVFGAGQFAAETQDGRRLLGHELAHVVQQSGADAIGIDQSGARRSPAFGRSPAAHGLAPLIRSSSSGFVLQREPDGSSRTKPLEPLGVIADRIARLALGKHQAEIQNTLGSKRGPVISVVRDELSNEIFVGLNNHIPAELAFSIKTSIESHQARIAAGELKVVHSDPDAAKGGHSEVIAFNRAIRAREARMAAMGIDRPMAEEEKKGL